ncbi:hypothetical protein HPB49_016269 [Dermacentor silvarum]|uniref:Uncharacterized protein n=1 Tax=Dermacentor silvarum TaxID=543639 RepID=A0ACB8D6S6_DERSI|nr:hypothetical protein HPB49_016269 [Dermacentor silvarum]
MLLERCQQGKTQNNESLHSLIWALAPKEHHTSLFSVETAVAEAVMKLYAGCRITSASILQELWMNPAKNSRCLWRKVGGEKETTTIATMDTTRKELQTAPDQHATARLERVKRSRAQRMLTLLSSWTAGS